MQNQGIKLHIGGTQPKEGWRILNIQPGSHVDYVGSCTDLSFLPDESCAEVYASHVLEHLGYNDELQPALNGIFRVLRPGGRLRVAVPDLAKLCWLFVQPSMTTQNQWDLMRMMFGGRESPHDIHMGGFTDKFLAQFLLKAGFRNIGRVSEFGEFKDGSLSKYAGHPISLNVEAFR